MKVLSGCTAEDSELDKILTNILLNLEDEDIEFLKLLNEARKHQDNLTLKIAFKMLDRGETDG